MYRIRKEWLVVLIMGIYFGLFHANPLRFLPTAILGAVMSYIMLETENMVYSSAFHMINNLLPMVLQEFLLKTSQLQQAQNQLTGTDVKQPFFPKEQMDRTVLKIAIPSAVFFIAGIICFGCGIYFESML